VEAYLREHYWEHGYVVLPGLFDPDDLERFERRFVEIASGKIPRPPKLVLMEDVEVVKGGVVPETPLHGVNKILSFEQDPVLFGYATDRRLVGAVRALIGADLVTISTNVFNKPPGVDGRHPLHQDLRYFALRPAEKIVGSWTAISPCTRENGCLAIVPQSHTGPLLRHGDPDWELVNFGFFAAEDVEQEARVHLPMEPGDTLLFHPLLIHGSGHNRTRRFRRAISAHYAAADCQRPEAPRKRAPVMVPIPEP